MPRTILFVFAGRRANIRIASRFYFDLLERDPGLEIHVWDLSQRDKSGLDHAYLQSLHGVHERLLLRDEFYRAGTLTSPAQNQVWEHYTDRSYRDTLLVKVDDDVLFLDTKRFGEFVERARVNSHAVTSALTINNGASTRLIPELWAAYKQLGIPLLDVHLSAEYAQRCHRWFLEHWRELLARPGELVAPDTWLSINCIAFNYDMAHRIRQQIGQRSPARIMDREFPPLPRAAGRTRRFRSVGDEGAVNLQTMLIDTGFVAGHFGFGPQVDQDREDGEVLSPEVQAELRAGYAQVAEEYLESSDYLQVSPTTVGA